ncbi:MAG: hypothetical protein JRG94_10220 [Deltaproteobacteria bacterium]|nr:hypothetical protein [Deltaproteobacteria bacterium]
MQQRVVEFTNLLRKSGIRVSVAEGINAFEALDELSIDDRELFKDALRATMVKRGDEIPTFDQLFELYWSGFYDNLRDSFGDMSDQMASMDVDMDALMKQIAEMIAQMDGDLDLGELARALLTQDLSQLENMIRDAAEGGWRARAESSQTWPTCSKRPGCLRSRFRPCAT